MLYIYDDRERGREIGAQEPTVEGEALTVVDPRVFIQIILEIIIWILNISNFIHFVYHVPGSGHHNISS